MVEKYDPEPSRKALADFLKKEKLSVLQWTKKAGLSESSLRHFLKGRNDSLSEATYVQLAHAASLIRGRPIPTAELRGEIKSQQVPVVATTGIIRTGRLRVPRPVIDDLADFGITQTAKGWAPRPPHGPSALYCFFMPTDIMAPWREPRHPIYFELDVDPGPEGYVILEGDTWEEDEDQDFRHVVLGYVLERNKERWRLKQYNPAEEIEVQVESVRRVHRVVDWPELMGFEESPAERERKREKAIAEFSGPL